jgi:uncharacterized protein
MNWFKDNFSKKTRKRILIIIFILIIFLAFFWKYPKNQVITKAGSCLFKAEVADTAYLHYQGLSNRSSLCSNCAMLFLFSQKKERSFVMRNMNFPLDIIFIADNRIVNIAHQALPEGPTPKKIYKSESLADAVLEINSEQAKKCDLKIGDIITWSQ